MYSTREAAEKINALKLFPANVKPLNYRGVARLCKLGKMPGAYGVRGYWCVPKEAIEKFAKATRDARNTTVPRPRKIVRKKKEA